MSAAEEIHLTDKGLLKLPSLGMWKMKPERVKSLFEKYFSGHLSNQKEPKVFCPRENCNSIMIGGVDRQNRIIHYECSSPACRVKIEGQFPI